MWRGDGERTVPDHGGVDEEGEECELVCGGVVLKEGGSVKVADGHIFRALGGDGASHGCEGKGFEEHCMVWVKHEIS